MGRVEKIIVTWADLKNSRHEYQPTRNTSVLIFIFSPEASSGVFLRLRHERNDHKRNRKRKEKDSKEIRNKKGKINKRSIWRYFRLIETCILCINIFINIIIIIIYIESNKIFKYYFPIFFVSVKINILTSSSYSYLLRYAREREREKKSGNILM